MAAYAHPEVLVDTSWLKGNLGNEDLRIVEVDYDPAANYNLGHIPGSVLIDWRKDINDPVRRDIVTKDAPSFPATTFTAKEPDETLRVYLAYVRESYRQAGKVFVDVRGPKEFSGEILAPPEYPTEHAQRGGHIPGAKNIPWGQAVNEDGTFKTTEELKALYEPKGVTPDKEVIAYCRIGERSSHTWFVLKYLLGYPDVRNYDGSWTEWGNLVRTPIEK